ncbi:MAG: tRNA lysidine(34) synthetase TilS [Anaerolineae bacterium]
MALLRDVAAYVERHHLIEPGARVVVGVSGGPDSVALLHVLSRLSQDYGLDLHIAHLDHRIRGAASAADRAFVADLAEGLGVPVTTRSADIPALAERERLAIEEAARRRRYGFLCQVAQTIGASHIAVGHNADDQAETVLMHLLRGAGPAGLRGMLPATRLRDYRLLPETIQPPTDLTLIRPLLSTPRSEIEAYCREMGLATRFDRSNLDTTYFRNKLRHEVLPYLAELNPRLSERLCNLAEVVRADYELLREFISVAEDTLLVAAHSDALVFDLARWREQPLAVQRALVRRSAYKLRRTLRDVDFHHVEQAVDVAQRGQTGAQAILPRELELTVGYSTLTIAEAGALHLPAERPWLEAGESRTVDIPGVTPLPRGWSLHTEVLSHWDIEVIRQNPNALVAWIDAAALGTRPFLRTRQEGDRFRPQGMHGAEVRLSDFLINIKLPREWREHLPLLVAQAPRSGNEGSATRILWVTGIRLSEEALVGPETERVVYFRFRGP